MAAAAKERPGSMAAILGLADEAVEALCKKIANVWPANYNCPGQLVISGETPSVEEACVEAESQGARRAIKLRGLACQCTSPRSSDSAPLSASLR